VQPIFSVPPGPRLRVTVDPKRVMVYGTARALQELHFIETPELDVPAGQARFEQEVHLDPGSGITRVDPPTVRVTVEQLPGGG
jgi:YbbR domain-containing protein